MLARCDHQDSNCPTLLRFLTSRMACRFTILGSGSRGNSAYLETEAVRLLIDAGLSARQIRQRLAAIGRSPESLTAILVTHEHSDHVQGLTGLDKLKLPVYCNRLTRDAIEFQLSLRLECRLFETGASFEVGDVAIESFSIPHDAQDPVGFLIRTATANIGFLTDLGHATTLVLNRVKPAHALVLEANYDVKLLHEDTRRPWSIKQRISGRHGHLSNDAAATAVEEIVSADLRHLFLGHLSQDCNRPELALNTVASRLSSLGASHVHTAVTSQSTATATLTL
jgi:phosphoribosyl 1,2-cyclic phosphodiesterase